MKSKRAKALLAIASLLVLAMGALVGCTSDEFASLLGGGGGLLGVSTPKFLVAIDAGGAGNNVNVFPVNPTTGVLSAQVSGAPFDMGLTEAITIAVHPNGHWLYVADGNDGTIHAYDFNTSTGVPSPIGTIANESGSFYLPYGTGYPVHNITITPNGLYLYAGNDDTMVSAFSINQSTGALTHIGDADIGAGACETGAVTATNSFVWVNDDCGDPWHIHTLTIGSNGALTYASTVDLLNVYSFLWSIAVSPDGKYVQAGDEGGDAQVYSYTVGGNGALTQVGTQTVLNASSDCRDISYSPDGKNFYAGDDEDTGVHGLTQLSDGSFTELPGSPFDQTSASSGDGQTVAARNGLLVFAGGDSQVVSYTRNTSTGSLTFITNTDTANNYPIAVNFVYVQ